MPSLAERPASARTPSDWNVSPTAPPLLWIAATFVCVAAAALVFLLPLALPLAPVHTVSDSYMAGFNNSVAVICSAGLGAVVLLATLWWRRDAPVVAMVWGNRLGNAWIAVVTLLSGCVLALEGWVVSTSHLRYLGDAGYFIEQAAVRRDTGRTLYTQIEFAYGPLLLLPEASLSRVLHFSMNVAYFTTLIAESTIGLLLLAWVLNALPISTGVRKAAFATLALGALTPHLGVNYTFFRFITPYALLLFGTRSRSAWQTVLLLSTGIALALLISPEVGLAMAAGVATFGLLRTWQAGWSWLVVAVVPLAVIGTLLLTLGRPYLVMAYSFAHGSLNLPVGPYPHILVLLFVLVWLVPFGLGCMLDLCDVFSARVLALCATSIAFIPAALGRSDPVHVLFNGVGLLVLSLVVVSGGTRRMRVAWLTVLAMFVLWTQFVNQRFFQVRTTEVLARTVVPRLPAPWQRRLVEAIRHRGPTFANLLQPQPETSFRLDTAALNRTVHGACVSTPIYVSPAVEDQLKGTHQYSPEFYAFWVNMMNPGAEQRSIESAGACRWMLLPSGPILVPAPLELRIAALQGMKLPYHQRYRALYNPGDAFWKDVQQHWEPVQDMGPYELYRQVAH